MIETGFFVDGLVLLGSGIPPTTVIVVELGFLVGCLDGGLIGVVGSSAADDDPPGLLVGCLVGSLVGFVGSCTLDKPPGLLVGCLVGLVGCFGFGVGVGIEVGGTVVGLAVG
jgi:hypothetical protein